MYRLRVLIFCFIKTGPRIHCLTPAPAPFWGQFCWYAYANESASDWNQTQFSRWSSSSLIAIPNELSYIEVYDRKFSPCKKNKRSTDPSRLRTPLMDLVYLCDCLMTNRITNTKTDFRLCLSSSQGIGFTMTHS
jgi:hypothetical protein